MYTSTKFRHDMKSAKCDKCNSTRLLYTKGVLLCNDCDNVIYANKRRNKYNATRTTANDGVKRDSKFEASIADELLMRKQAGDIKDYESQYRVEIPLFDENGTQRLVVRHKVDFRIHHNDGSYELCEAKGVETSDYKWRRQLLENFWLPNHKDHIYTVRKQR